MTNTQCRITYFPTEIAVPAPSDDDSRNGRRDGQLIEGVPEVKAPRWGKKQYDLSIREQMEK